MFRIEGEEYGFNGLGVAVCSQRAGRGVADGKDIIIEGIEERLC